MGNTASDLFYPDNPKRRERAQGLRQDILQYVQDFEREKAKKDEAFNVLKAELDEVLHRLGVQTRDELDEYIRVHIRHDADLKAYDGLRARIDTWDRDANLIVDIVGLAGVGAFAIGGVAALAGIVTTAAALGALEIAGGLVAAAGLALIVLSVFEGADQREKLREAIRDMVEKRAEAFQHVQRMRILNTWARSIVSALQKGQTFDHLQDLLHEGLKEPWDACSLPYCRDKLREMDRSQRVWTDEDSGALYYSEQSTSQPDTSRPDETAAKVPRVELTFTPLDGRVSRSVAVIVHGALSDSVCLATAGNDTWFLSGKPVTDISGLETERYDLERVPPGRTGKLDVYRACRLKVESWSWVAPPTLL